MITLPIAAGMMMKKKTTDMFRTIELDYDTVDRIVLSELKDTYLMHLKDKSKTHIDDITDTHRLLSAIQTILEYYMSAEEREEWSYKLQGEIVLGLYE